jgi:hypothetical protein
VIRSSNKSIEVNSPIFPSLNKKPENQRKEGKKRERKREFASVKVEISGGSNEKDA